MKNVVHTPRQLQAPTQTKLGNNQQSATVTSTTGGVFYDYAFRPELEVSRSAATGSTGSLRNETLGDTTKQPESGTSTSTSTVVGPALNGNGHRGSADPASTSTSSSITSSIKPSNQLLSNMNQNNAIAGPSSINQRNNNQLQQQQPLYSPQHPGYGSQLQQAVQPQLPQQQQIQSGQQQDGTSSIDGKRLSTGGLSGDNDNDEEEDVVGQASK